MGEQMNGTKTKAVGQTDKESDRVEDSDKQG